MSHVGVLPHTGTHGLPRKEAGVTHSDSKSQLCLNPMPPFCKVTRTSKPAAALIHMPCNSD